MNNVAGAIGVFDSGYGGLTILSHLKKKLPEYDFLYLGDNARAPYGTRSERVVYNYTLQAVKKLFEENCQLIILACNSASAKALRTIQRQDLPRIDSERRVLGVIRPSVEEVVEVTRTRHVGVFATHGTVRSNAFEVEFSNISMGEITTFQTACPMWVPLVENRAYETEGGEYFIREKVEDLLKQSEKIDTLLLACTHYGVLKPQICCYVPPSVRVIEQGDIIQRKLIAYLQRHPEIDRCCLKNGKVTYLTTEDPKMFEQNASFFLGENITASFLNTI